MDSLISTCIKCANKSVKYCVITDIKDITKYTTKLSLDEIPDISNFPQITEVSGTICDETNFSTFMKKLHIHKINTIKKYKIPEYVTSLFINEVSTLLEIEINHPLEEISITGDINISTLQKCINQDIKKLSFCYNNLYTPIDINHFDKLEELSLSFMSKIYFLRIKLSDIKLPNLKRLSITTRENLEIVGNLDNVLDCLKIKCRELILNTNIKCKVAKICGIIDGIINFTDTIESLIYYNESHDNEFRYSDVYPYKSISKNIIGLANLKCLTLRNCYLDISKLSKLESIDIDDYNVEIILKDVS